MADSNYDSEKIHEKNVETQEEQVSTSSEQDQNVISTQLDDPVETVSASTIMAIFVSLKFSLWLESRHTDIFFFSLWECHT